MIHINKTRHSIRIKFQKAVAIPTLTYMSEFWGMMKKEDSTIQSAEIQFLQNTLNYTLQDISNK